MVLPVGHGSPSAIWVVVIGGEVRESSGGNRSQVIGFEGKRWVFVFVLAGRWSSIAGCWGGGACFFIIRIPLIVIIIFFLIIKATGDA